MNMKKTFLYCFVLLLGCLLVFFTGCPTGNEDPVSGEEDETEEEQTSDGSTVFTIKNLYLPKGSAVKYYSLKTGKAVPASKKNTTEWDFAVENQSDTSYLAFFYTNSGVTAAQAGSGGQARVWYTDKVDFDAVVLNDRVDVAGTEYEPYSVDVARYFNGMDGENSTAMNIMSYFGFSSGDGSAENPFGINAPPVNPDGSLNLAEYIFYDFNKKAAYKGTGGMPPHYDITGQVYIIQHADGTGYSKLQVTRAAYATGYNWTFRIQFSKVE
jgi:hypothetical protein